MAVKLFDSAGQPLSLMHVWTYSEVQPASKHMVTREVKLLQGDHDLNKLYCVVHRSEEKNPKGGEIDLEGMDVSSRIKQLTACEVVVSQSLPVFTEKFVDWKPQNIKLILADGSLKWQVMTGKRIVQIPFSEMNLDIDKTGFSDDLKTGAQNLANLDPETILNVFKHRVTVHQVKVDYSKPSFTVGVRSLRYDELIASGLSWQKGKVSLTLQNHKWVWRLNKKKAHFSFTKNLSLDAPVLSGFSGMSKDRRLALLELTDVSVRHKKFHLKPISHPSLIDKSLKVSPYQWAVTVVTHQRVYPCAEHAEIVIEGINDGYFTELKPGEYFLIIAHFKGNFANRDEDIEIKLCDADVQLNYLRRSFVWKRSSKHVQQMLDKIKERKESRVDFARCGGKTLFAKEGEENCWTFIYSVLPEADIYPSRTFTIQNYLFDHFFHVLGLNSWRDPSNGEKIDRRGLTACLKRAERRIDDWTKGKEGVAQNNKRLLKFMEIMRDINLESVQMNGGSDVSNPLFRVATKYTKKEDFFSEMSLEGLEGYKKIVDGLL